VFKALALGATAVGIGRPFLWGLGAFGQAGVDRVLEILQGELKLVMGNCGTRTVADITRGYVATPDWKI
jgi:isopentenyl diphosphate isomerase/L-lactate dehydrogenase-like FMN-dependent dehydrogenase